MNVIDILAQRNEEFAGGRFSPGLKILPSLKTMIVGCVDPRVDPVDVFGLQPGEAAVIRNVGGRITPHVLQTMAMLRIVSTSNGGTDCGINSLVHSPDVLATYFGVQTADLDALAIADPYKAVAVDVAALKAYPLLPGSFLVSGVVYDVASGRFEVTVPPALLRREQAT